MICCTGTPLGIIRSVENNARLAFMELAEEYDVWEGDFNDVEKEWTTCVLKNIAHNPTDWFNEMFKIQQRLKKFGLV